MTASLPRHAASQSSPPSLLRAGSPLGTRQLSPGKLTVLVAGTAGGVGTTTVTGLLFAGLAREDGGAPRLADHSGGQLGWRLADGDEVAAVNDRRTLHDLGAHAADVGLARLIDASQRMIVVTAATPLGCEAVGNLLDLAGDLGPADEPQLLVVAVETFGRHKLSREYAALAGRLGRSVIVLPEDPALAVGGHIPVPRLRPKTLAARDQLVSAYRALTC